MSEITTLHKGKFVLVDLVDETIELTVENNVYSRSEALELIAELEQVEPFLLKRVDTITEIDIEIAACEQAIIDAYVVKDVGYLEKRIQELSKKRKELIENE
jgi:hypothetical protein